MRRSPAEGAGIQGFADAGDVSDYALKALERACGSGLIQGLDGNRLDPRGGATRAQAATILMRFGLAG